MKEEIEKRIAELKKQEDETYFGGNVKDDVARRLKMETLSELLFAFTD